MKNLAHRNEFAGISKQQWLFILLAGFVPLAFSAVSVWQDEGTDVMLQVLANTYNSYPNSALQTNYNPLLEIVLELVRLDTLLVLLAWLVVFISATNLFQRLPLFIRYAVIFLSVICLGNLFTIAAGFLMPVSWLPKFHDYLLGMPVSQFALHWSYWIVFPITFVLLGYAMLLSIHHRPVATPNLA